MRVRRIAPLLAASLVAIACHSCHREPTGPRVAESPRRAELGSLWLGEERVRDFECRNVGDAPLTLGEVRSTCGCLLAEFSHADVLPGEARQLAVTFRADKNLGHVDKELRIATNDRAMPWLVLTLAAEVAVLYEFDPPAVAWPDLVLGDSRQARVKIRVADGSNVRFQDPTLEDPGFAAARIDGASTEVEVRFDGRARVGTHLFHVVLPGDHPRVAQARIPVSATVLSRLEFPDGERIDFRDVARSRGATITRRVRSRGRSALAFAHPQGDAVLTSTARGGPIAVAWKVVEPGRAWDIELSVAAGAAAGSLVGRVDVKLPGTDEPPHALTLAGRVVER